MKSNTPDLIKFQRLQWRLSETKRGTAGLLELLWIATAKNAPRGDIGKLTNEEIAVLVDWHSDPELLVLSLVETGWIDRCGDHRLLIHDWCDHAPNYIRGALARHGKSLLTPSEHTPLGKLPGSKLPKAAPQKHAATKPSQAKPSQVKKKETFVSSTQAVQASEANEASETQEAEVEFAGFDIFWQTYPTRNGKRRGKQKTKQMFLAMTNVDQLLAVTAAKNYQSEEFIRDPERFLKDGYWRDFATAELDNVGESRAATLAEAEELFGGGKK